VAKTHVRRISAGLAPSGRHGKVPPPAAPPRQRHMDVSEQAKIVGIETMKPMKFGVGQAVKRVEDVRFITGRGKYTSDYVPEGSLHAVFLRSPHAHATFSFGDLETARAMPGVKAVYAAADFADLGALPCYGVVGNSDKSQTPLKPYPVLATGAVQHVGDAVAMVIAESEREARDAAESLDVDWSPLPCVTDMRAAVEQGAPQVFSGAPGNVAYDAHIGDKAKTDALFAGAAHVVSIAVVNQRVVANYMEPRAAVGEYDSASGRYKLHVGSQGVHGFRDTIATKILNIAPEKLHVVTDDVGGGFGIKSVMHREYPLVLEAAKRLGRPVVWLADRTEHFVGDAHGRDNLTTAEMALDANGRFLAMRVDILGGVGGYPSQFGPFIPWLGASMATGPYDIDTLHVRCRGVYTHTVPVDAYRGAGRPEAAFVLERLVDRCARTLDIPREEIRARNFVKPDQMPYRTQTNRTYDVGEFEGAMRESLAKADYAGFDARAEAAKKHGLIRGIGFASYIECTAWADSEEGSVELGPDGQFTVLIGTQSNGQGHETAYAQVVSQYLDVPLDRIKVVQGDTERVATGFGTGGSRSIPIGAVMVTRASEKLVASLKELAADKLEAAIGDLEASDGAIRIAGTDRSISYAEIAQLPAATPQKLKAIEAFTPPDATYPNGTHTCEVEIDPQTGVVRIERYTVVDDFGFTLNPMLLAGQVHGGIAQGVGQALMERAVYSEDGQLLTASFMDYSMPRADNFPHFHFETRNVPSTTNPLGLKGAGEAGSIGSTPAVMNAVNDALWRAYRIAHIDMPATPLAVFSAIAAAGGP
jgi:carbon-monoxide dehydrogenase large subunit